MITKHAMQHDATNATCAYNDMMPEHYDYKTRYATRCNKKQHVITMAHDANTL
jgi:hypothetical protein